MPKHSLSRTVAALFCTVSLVASAGTATIRTGGSGKAIFEYSETMLRIGDGGADGYAVVRDGSLFAVTFANGQPMVIDAGAMMRSMAGAGAATGMPQMAPADLNGEFLGIDSTGRKETVAGIEGEVYILRTRDDAGQEQSDEVVLSSDKRAREFFDALYMMLGTVQDAASKQALAQGKEIKAELDKMNAGVLRFGDDMAVTAIDSDPVDATRFALPAQPMSLEGLGSMLGNMGNSASPPPAPLPPAMPRKP